MNYRLDHRQGNELAEVYRRLADLERQVRQIPSRPARMHPSALEIDIDQAAHGFGVGKAVTVAGGVWSLFTDFGSSAYTPARPLWGIITEVPDDNRFRIAISGEGVTTSTTLEPGQYYTFVNGDPVLLQTVYPPIEGGAAGVAVMAYSASSVCIANDARFQGLQSQDGTYTIVSHEDIGAGHYVVWAGAPTGESPLAMADEANPWKWTNVGIALFEVGSAGTWLVLTHGVHEWYSYNNGDVRPGWMTTPPYNVAQRIYLSDSAPGQYAATEPAFKVYAGISAASYAPADPPSPECTTFVAKAVGQGVPYPIPASGGGTGRDVSTLDEHSMLFMDTYGMPPSRKIAGLLSATPDFAVVAQKNGEMPVHLSLDLAATGSFLVNSGVLYSLVCGKKTSTTAPTLVTEFLNWNGTEWAPYSLLTYLGHILSHNGTTYVQVDASTPRSILGVAGASNAVPAPIVASADGQVLQRLAGVVQFAAFSGLPAVTSADEGKMLWVTAAGAWQASRDVYLGDNPLTASSVQGSFGVVTSADGDYIKTSSAGLEFFDRSVSTTVPLIKIALGHASLNATGRQIAVGEAHVCDPSTGTVKTMMLLRSDVY